MAELMCLGCLRHQIQLDFSGRIVFCYGNSESAFPLASTAIVQVSDSSGEASSSQFLLSYLPSHSHRCLSNYIAECTQNLEDSESPSGYYDGIETNKNKIVEDESEVILADGATKTSFQSSSSCTHRGKFSCGRIITALMPLAHVNTCSRATFDEVVYEYSSGTLEDHILDSLSLLIDGKASGRDGVNFLALLGIPSYEEIDFPGSLRHPNVAPVLGMVKSPGYANILVPKTPYTLENILRYSPDALKSEWHMNFLIYQLVSSLAYIHGLGVAHGNINPSTVKLTESSWAWLHICDEPGWFGSGSSSTNHESVVPMPIEAGCCVEGCPFQGLYADLKLSPSIDWDRDFNLWWRGDMSNFEYLLVLNRLAGRTWGDHTFHTVMPWVIDFSTKPDENSDVGWRDLSKSKWRLAKGDEQLDFTYSTSEIPHHVSDECLSELAVCSYKARRLPLSVLRTAVRSVYEPNEYPSTMQRLYQWTPDECIPEFYCDPEIFCSIHLGMSNLAVPSWAGSPEEFIRMHRDALESDRVSNQLHHWIDITFGYKMFGPASIAAKNVMLPSSDPAIPKSAGRRQLFTRPHPKRRAAIRKASDEIGSNDTVTHSSKNNEVGNGTSLLSGTDSLQQLEEASAFSVHARHLSALYGNHVDDSVKDVPYVEQPQHDNNEKQTSLQSDPVKHGRPTFSIDINHLLEYIEVTDELPVGYQELLLWRQKSSCSMSSSEDSAKDIFSIGCILAELHLGRPLFDSTAMAKYLESGILPRSMSELPPHARLLVQACIEKDWTRRPSAKILLDSPYFTATVKAAYLFLAPLQLIAKRESRLRYAATFATKGALKAIGTFAAEMCAPYCLSLVIVPLSDSEAEWAYTLLKELIKCLKPKSVKALILPAIQKILQTTGYSHLKVSLLQNSLMRDIWNQVGTQTYLDMIHPLVISNVHTAAHKGSAAAAAVLLIGSSEELGVPITIHQTTLPLIHGFGKGLCSDGIDALIRIGSLLGATFIVRQMIPLLKHVVHSCIGVSNSKKSEPVQNWSVLALIDCLMTIAGLVAFLPKEVVLKELIQDQSCLHVLILMQTSLEIGVLQVAATSLMSICQQIGPELTALHILPQLKELFDELAFSQEKFSSLSKSSKTAKQKNDREAQIESRMDLVFLLYPSFASLLGIEKLRQCCATWLLLEQYLLRYHNWKWESTGESLRTGSETIMSKRLLLGKGSTPEYHPAKLLLNGVGWSIPQSQGSRGAKHSMPPQRRASEVVQQSPVEIHATSSHFAKFEPWFWYPSAASSWDGLDFLGRVGGLKDELPWKIRSSVIYSVRAHQGAIRSLAIGQDESTVFTTGIGPGFKGTVQKWDMTRFNSISSYYGHEEVVNDICVLSSTGRVASCDGTIHVWNSRTGKLIYLFAESSVDSPHVTNPLSSSSKINSEQTNLLNPSTLSGGLLNNAFDVSLYTCMHQVEFDDNLVVGTGNGSLRFINVARGQKLHLWRGESIDSGFPSLVSSICSCGSDKMQTSGGSASPAWFAAGLSSGHCRLFDTRSGNVIASWRAHDGYVTKLTAPDDHLLVSSSLDKTLRIWDLRRNCASQPTIFRGHTDGISSFSVWGQDIISISRNKIGLSSLSKFTDEERRHRITPQTLYMAEQGTRNLSVLSSINILPFSRLFVVGTEDGYLRICC